MCKALKIQEIDKNIITHEIDRLKMMHYSIKNRGLNLDGSNFAKYFRLKHFKTNVTVFCCKTFTICFIVTMLFRLCCLVRLYM